MKTGELYDLISKMGIKLGGTDPQNNYSSLLYGRDEFESHGREGWTLKLTPEQLMRNITDNPPGKPDNY